MRRFVICQPGGDAMRYWINVSIFIAVSVTLMALVSDWHRNRPVEVPKPVEARPFGELQDGIYTGTEGYAVVQVEIKNGTILSAKVLQNKPGSYSKSAETVVDRVIEAQSLEVDMITGATATSRVIVDAIRNAFDTVE